MLAHLAAEIQPICWGTQMAQLGVPTDVRSLVLNHSPRGNGVTDKVYNRFANDAEKQQELQLWETHLQQIISEQLDASFFGATIQPFREERGTYQLLSCVQAGFHGALPTQSAILDGELVLIDP